LPANDQPPVEASTDGDFSLGGRRCNVNGAGFVFGLLAFIFAASALGKIKRLEKQLKEAGVLKEGTHH
jgi:hypothetical protein